MMSGLGNFVHVLLRSNKIRLYACAFLLATFLVDGFLDRKEAIEANLPYAVNMDEGYLTVPAKKILTSGDLNPHVFHYPSLPIYTITAGMLLGYLAAAPELPANAQNLNVIGRVTYPYYQAPTVIKGAKLLFAFISVLAFFFIGYTAYKAFDNVFLLFMPALILSISRFYFSESWSYLNVDIIGAATVSFYYFVVFVCLNRDSYISRAVVPGLAAGLVIASKYTLYPILFVMPVAILLFGEKDKFQKIALYFIVGIGSFFIFTPFALVELNTFLSNIAYQVNHYQVGHPGHDIASGFEHMKKELLVIQESYGSLLTLLGFAGILYGLKIRWKHSLLLLIFPLLLLLYMGSQNVFFARNVLPVVTLFPIFISLGCVLSYRLVLLAMQRYLPINKVSRRGHERPPVEKVLLGLQGKSSMLTVIFVAAILYFATPVGHVYGMKAPVDTRIQALQWITENIPNNSNIFLDKSIGMDIRPIAKKYNIKMISFRMVKTGMIMDQITPKDDQSSYIIAPEFRYLKVYPERKMYSDAMNQKVQHILSKSEVIKSFGRTPLWISATYRASWYDKELTYMPAGRDAKFSIYRYSLGK